MPTEPVIRLRGIHKAYPISGGAQTRVLEGLDLDVWSGQLVAIRGESGCGKSTLLRIIGLIDNRYRGSYQLAGHTVRNGTGAMPWSDQEELRAQSVGFIFQEDRLFDHLDVRANIELPLRIRRHAGAAERRQLEALIHTVYRDDELGTGSLLDRRRRALSGGQRQRASVLRAMAHAPLFLLADEPTASLDRKLKEEVFAILRRLGEAGRTIVVVSHDAIFEDADVVYELRDGVLRRCRQRIPSGAGVADLEAGAEEDGDHPAGTGSEAPAVDTSTSASPASDPGGSSSAVLGWLRSLVPRTPLSLQLSLASKDLFRSWLFTLLALGALTTGAFQLTLLWSLEAGTRALLDDLIRKGSRLNRITVAVKPGNLLAEERLPERARMLAISGVRALLPRREGIYRVRDSRGRERFETVFGLTGDDPELEKLVFTAGGPFSDEAAFEVIMSERSIQRLFDDLPDDGVTDPYRRSLIGRSLWMAIARPPAGVTLDTMRDDVPLEVERFQMRVVGIVARAESDRNFYFPHTTQLVLERWRLDQARTFALPIAPARDGWTATPAALARAIDFPWEERAHVYLDELEQVIPAHQALVAMGYQARAEIFQYQWVIHTRRLANLVITGLVGLILLVAGMVIAGNIVIGVRMRLKEIVLLKLLGMRNGDISLIYIWNAVMAAVLGTLCGYLAGSFAVRRLRAFVEAHYQSADFARLLGPTEPFFLPVVFLGVALALLFSVIPAYRAGRTDPVTGFGA